MTQRRLPSVSASFCIRRRAAVLAAVLLAPAVAAGAQPAPRIGVVDPQKVVEKLLRWQDARERLHDQAKQAEKLIADQTKECDRLRGELDYFKPGSRDHEERKARLAAAQATRAKLRARLERDLARASRTAAESMRRDIADAVKAYALAHGFDVVVDARAVFYVSGGADISFEVAREMNKRYNKKQAEKEPNTAKDK